MAAAHRRLGRLSTQLQPSAGGGNRVCVVTGANKGIGLALAKALASTPGLHVIGTTRTVANGEAAQAELAAEGVHVEFRQLDIDSADSVESFVGELGPVDVLVNK